MSGVGRSVPWRRTCILWHHRWPYKPHRAELRAIRYSMAEDRSWCSYGAVYGLNAVLSMIIMPCHVLPAAGAILSRGAHKHGRASLTLCVRSASDQTGRRTITLSCRLTSITIMLPCLYHAFA